MACMCPSCHQPSRLASYIIYVSALIENQALKHKLGKKRYAEFTKEIDMLSNVFSTVAKKRSGYDG
jgi:hypothetical protein